MYSFKRMYSFFHIAGKNKNTLTKKKNIYIWPDINQTIHQLKFTQKIHKFTKLNIKIR